MKHDLFLFSSTYSLFLFSYSLQLQVKAMCSRSDSIVGEYEVQNNDGANEND